jgi:hypothetical protein
MMDNIKSDDIRNLTLSDLLLRLEEKLQFTVTDDTLEINDVFIRLTPDPDLKFIYTSEARGIVKYQGHEINFAVSIKQGLPQSIILDPVSEFDNAERTLIENKAVALAVKTLNCESVHEARSSVIKYQMLQDLIRLLES